MAEYQITEQMRMWGKANGFNVDEHYEYFVDYLANKSGKPYKDLDAAFRQCVRSDWGRIRAQKRVNPLVGTTEQRKREPEPPRNTHRVLNGMEWVPATATEDGYWRKP